MATTTPNFGWAVPTSTDLVKDGAVAIETLGDAIDASLVDLKGGTTGQVLAKATGTDMDFSWTTPAASASGLTLITSSTFSSVASVSLPDNTFSSTYDNYYLTVNFASGSASGDSFVRFRTSGTNNSSASYFVTGQKITLTPTQTLIGESSQTSIRTPYIEASSGTETNFSWTIFNPNLSAVTMMLMNSSVRSFTTDIRSSGFNGTTVFDSMTIFPVSGTFSGTYRIYGLQKS
jgi:hypothetical protein